MNKNYEHYTTINQDDFVIVVFKLWDGYTARSLYKVVAVSYADGGAVETDHGMTWDEYQDFIRSYGVKVEA